MGFDKLKKKECSCCHSLIGNSDNEPDYISLGNGVYVCGACAKRVSDVFVMSKGASVMASEDRGESQGETTQRKTLSTTPRANGIGGMLTPMQIKSELDKYVVGQDEAKKLLAVASYNHYKRAALKDPGLKKSNILLAGPTGCGKTYLVQTLARILDVPVAVVPATRLTEAGYIGDDVETVVQRLVAVAGGNIEKAQRGIVFIDEIDKLTSSSSETKRAVGGKGVQQALLPVIEGCTVQIPSSGTVQGAPTFSSMIEVDTTNILFVCGGAFPDMQQIIEKRLRKDKHIGFSADPEMEEADYEEDNVLLQATTEDFIEFGLIPELLGRLPVRAALHALSADVLRRILTDPQDALVQQYRKLFAFDGINLTFEDEALAYVADLAHKEGTGARSLRTIMENALQELMFTAPGTKGLKELRITLDYLKNRNDSSIYVYQPAQARG